MAQHQTDLAFHDHDHSHDACIADGIALAEARAAAAGQRLTPQRRQVLEILLADHQPLGAYEILERMADKDGNKPAPPIAYRALDFLRSLGVVHRIDRLNAFMACGLDHGGKADHSDCAGGMAFLICERCNRAAELSGDSLRKQLSSLADGAGFEMHSATVELMGLCPKCRNNDCRDAA
ncbi:MAG: Fur family transcriptional regulator [Pseudomonadota bacterium]